MRIILDIPISLSDAILAITGKVDSKFREITVFAVSTDSRACEDGDLFFSLAGAVEKRIEHARSAALNGAYTVCDGVGFITVANTELALLAFAALYKSRLPKIIHTVGITGSVGKSTATRYTASLLSLSYRVAATIGNFNNRIGISLSILCAKRDTEILVLEMGMNHRGEIAEMASLVRPDICVITNVGSAHIGNLGSKEAIRDAKCEIITSRATAVIVPASEPLLRGIGNRVSISLSDSEKNERVGADITLVKREGNYTLKGLGTAVDEIGLGVLAVHCAYNALIAGAVALSVGMPSENIRRGLNSLSDDFCKGRILDAGGFTLIDDTYNCSPEAAKAMLDYLSVFPAPHFAVFADMLELGKMSGELHYALGMQAGGLDRLYLVGEYAEYTAIGAIDGGLNPAKVRVLRDIDAKGIADLLLREIEDGTVLIKGSHATGIYEVAKILCERTKKG